MNKHLVSEIFKMVDSATSTQDKIKVLKTHQENADLTATIVNMFHSGVQFHFDKLPDYKPLKGHIDMGMISYAQALKKTYLFIKGDKRASPNMTQKQRETLLIQLLESLSAEEAEVFGHMIMKKSGVKGLTKGLIKNTWPSMKMGE